MSKQTKEQLEIIRLKQKIKELDEQLLYKQKLLNQRDRKINNLRIEHTDTIAKLNKKFENFIELDKKDVTKLSRVDRRENENVIYISIGKNKEGTFKTAYIVFDKLKENEKLIKSKIPFDERCRD